MDNLNILGRRPFDFETASQILAAAKISDEPLGLTPLKGGANNRVFKLDLKHGSPLIVKSYFQHSHDPRPRLKAEFEFLSFAWDRGIRSIPQPLYKDQNQNLALYSYLDGSLATAADSHAGFVQDAVSFLYKLNQNREKAYHLPTAAEACLQVDDYFQTVERKLQRLLESPNTLPLEQRLHRFLQNRLIPEWVKIKEKKDKTALHLLNPCRKDWIIFGTFGRHGLAE